jgi:hypothetical protein
MVNILLGNQLGPVTTSIASFKHSVLIEDPEVEAD